MTSRWVCVVAMVTFAPVSARADEHRIARGAMVHVGVGAAGGCLGSDTATRDHPCTYLAGAELTLRPIASSPVRAFGGVRSSLYTNDYPGDRSGPKAYYSTHGREIWLGAAGEIYALSDANSAEVFVGLGRGLGTTKEWEYPNVGRPLAVTDNDYWFSDLGLQLIHASPNHWFLSARMAWTVVRFAPEEELLRSLGWQLTVLPRGEIGIGLHF